MSIEDVTLNYKSLSERVMSFVNWNEAVDPIDLAINGFYSRCNADNGGCICFKCGVEIYRWQIGAPPFDDLLKYSPNCPYAEFVKYLKNVNNQVLKTISEEAVKILEEAEGNLYS